MISNIIPPDRSNEQAHVRTNVLHQIEMVHKYGLLPITYFENILSKEEYLKEKAKTTNTWYALSSETMVNHLFSVNPLNVFTPACFIDCVEIIKKTNFLGLMRQEEIAGAGEEACNHYKQTTPLNKQTGERLREVIFNSILKKKEALNKLFSKLQAVANPRNGKGFIEEVCRF